MSRSARRPKPRMPGDGCFLCDGPARLAKHRAEKEAPDPEQRAELVEVPMLEEPDCRPDCPTCGGPCDGLGAFLSEE